jgi:hypothetical protein
MVKVIHHNRKLQGRRCIFKKQVHLKRVGLGGNIGARQVNFVAVRTNQGLHSCIHLAVQIFPGGDEVVRECQSFEPHGTEMIPIRWSDAIWHIRR